MTYIEFFDKIASENISACLTYTPERVVYVGDNSKLMRKHISYYQRIFRDRGCEIAFEYRTVSKSNLENAVKVLTELVETYDDCVFDITGGEEILTLALGIVYAQNPDKNIQIHKFNLRSNMVYDCDMDGETIYRDTPTLSVEEHIRIYGGDVVFGDIDEDKTYFWEMTDEFRRDIRTMWEICRKNVRSWNTQIGVLEAICQVGSADESGLTVAADISSVDIHLSRYNTDYRKIRGVLPALVSSGLLTAYEDDSFSVTVSFKNPQIKRCLTKAGLALELKVYLTALELKEKDGAPVYDDALNGVFIDWDGTTSGAYGSENEVDILLMHDMVPVFISCKNGQVTVDELYKLTIVAERFGGEYSKKVLVATALDSMGEGGKYIRQRARDMGIRIIDDLAELTEEEVERKLKNLWNS